METLPVSDHLPVERLTSTFRNVTNSYKFLWFLAILEHIEEQNSPIIALDQLFARMVAWVWYPSIYFKVSFGKQDQLTLIADRLRQAADLDPIAKRKQVIDAALVQLSTGSEVGLAIREIGRYVPMRFLRPFFPNELNGISDSLVNPAIVRFAAQYFSSPETPCLYRFISGPLPAIEIHERWYRYLHQHLYVLNGFCLWHLLNYLQRNNPIAPNLATKLFEPTHRELGKAHKFWRFVLSQLGTRHCIYSGIALSSEGYSLDHFLPWRFVAHDLLWNIVPTPRSVNSAKSDRLPDIDLYWNGFTQLQYEAVEIVSKTNENGLLEDYTMLCKCESVEALRQISYDDFSLILHDTIIPQMQMARNMGFSGGWRYK